MEKVIQEEVEKGACMFLLPLPGAVLGCWSMRCHGEKNWGFPAETVLEQTVPNQFIRNEKWLVFSATKFWSGSFCCVIEAINNWYSGQVDRSSTLKCDAYAHWLQNRKRPANTAFLHSSQGWRDSDLSFTLGKISLQDSRKLGSWKLRWSF